MIKVIKVKNKVVLGMLKKMNQEQPQSKQKQSLPKQQNSRAEKRANIHNILIKEVCRAFTVELNNIVFVLIYYLTLNFRPNIQVSAV